jgi:hypothetical protein
MPSQTAGLVEPLSPKNLLPHERLAVLQKPLAVCARASAEREPRSAARRAVWHCPASAPHLSTTRVIHSVKVQFLLNSDSAENLRFISDACDHLVRPNGRLSRTKWAGNSDQTGGLFRLNGRPPTRGSRLGKGTQIPSLKGRFCFFLPLNTPQNRLFSASATFRCTRQQAIQTKRAGRIDANSYSDQT